MEVAGQWRREWAGTAEYGKVTEGGVTRRVARAMEVLHASAPGARVRVMRAAYHSSAGPGAPASSYLMHSSRQVLSSGYDFLEPPPSKPLEISSTPLALTLDSEVEKENYKVSEPDDYDISEPSKWRGSSGKNSIRMPSEESSSADNASIIDLDSRTSSQSTFKRNSNNRISPLLDAPVALSTLKYTSLLNSSDEWNNRRKSYSFEDTSTLNNSISSENKSFNMDSSTDSGICKSSEIVNDSLNNINSKIATDNSKVDPYQDQSFKNWLSRNRSTPYRGSSTTPPRTHNGEEFQLNQNNIILQSSGKVTITLPIDTKDYENRVDKTVMIDDSDRRTKKVEFCKTELHFAADTGTVNIIATDDKPPPSTDFRRRRSAFVPLNDKIDRSITLFGDKSDFLRVRSDENISAYESGETDENTAATKSILKNKIPKPKPYLLGENMVLGSSNDDPNSINLNNNAKSSVSAISLINRQLQSQREYTNSNGTISSGYNALNLTTLSNDTYGTQIKGPHQRGNNDKPAISEECIEILGTKLSKKSPEISSSALSQTKIRQLRGSDLAYFGIDNNDYNDDLKIIHSQDNLQEEILHSVKLVQQVSNSVCNSEAESDDTPEYQNMPPLNFNTPIPKSRSKYDHKDLRDQKVLKPIREQDVEQTNSSEFNNNSLKRHKESLKSLNQTNSELRKSTKESRQNNINIIGSESVTTGKTGSNSIKRVKSNKENLKQNTNNIIKQKSETPLYVNVSIKARKEKVIRNEDSSPETLRQKQYNLHSSKNKKDFQSKNYEKTNRTLSPMQNEGNIIKPKSSIRSESKDRAHEIQRENSHRAQKKSSSRRTEKLVTPDLHENDIEKRSQNINKIIIDKNNYKHKIQSIESQKPNKHQHAPKVITEHDKKEKRQNKEKGTVRKTMNIQSNITGNTNKIATRDSLNSENSKREKMTDVKIDKSAKSKPSKYVINYDDKNGTVSSICKIKSGPGTYKRKIIPIENKINQENKATDKSINRIALLQTPDRQWTSYGQEHSTKKWKSSINTQKSCQLL